jgi:hypothetical protein
MSVNRPVGDNARKGAVRKRSQVKTKIDGAGSRASGSNERALRGRYRDAEILLSYPSQFAR